MRRSNLSLNAAARKAKTTPETVRRYAGANLTLRNQRWQAVIADRAVRHMYVFSGGQLVNVDVRGSRKASEVSGYFSAVNHYLTTGDDSRLQPFVGKTVAGYEYETDLDAIDEIGRRGELSIESIYRSVA